MKNGYCRNGHRIGVYYESEADHFQVFPPENRVPHGLHDADIRDEPIDMITYRKVWCAKDHHRWYEWET